MERDHLRFWMGSLWKAGNKPATVHTRYRAVKRFFEWCVNEGERIENPIASIDPPRLPKFIQPDYQPKDVEKLLKAAARDKTAHA
jgi:site-specific recombinase XerD